MNEEGYNAVKLSLIRNNLSYLMGEVLTVIDASVEGDKNKAMKDLVKDKFRDKQIYFYDLAFNKVIREGVNSLVVFVKK